MLLNSHSSEFYLLNVFACFCACALENLLFRYKTDCNIVPTLHRPRLNFPLGQQIVALMPLRLLKVLTRKLGLAQTLGLNTLAR